MPKSNLYYSKLLQVEAKEFKGSNGTVRENLDVAEWCNGELMGDEGQFILVDCGDCQYEIEGGTFITRMPDGSFCPIAADMFHILFEALDAHS